MGSAGASVLGRGRAAHVLCVLWAGTCRHARFVRCEDDNRCVCLWLGPAAYAGACLGALSAHDSLNNATDAQAHWPDASSPDPYCLAAQPDAIPVLYDLPIGLVNRVLYRPAVPRARDTQQ